MVSLPFWSYICFGLFYRFLALGLAINWALIFFGFAIMGLDLLVIQNSRILVSGFAYMCLDFISNSFVLGLEIVGLVYMFKFC